MDGIGASPNQRRPEERHRMRLVGPPSEKKVQLKREGDPFHPTSNAKSEVPSKAKDFIKERAVAVLAREE